MSARALRPPARDVPPPSGPIRPFDLPRPEVGKLDNGLELRLLRAGGVPLVSGCLAVDAGEAAVAPGLAGLAVFTGDALTGGTERRSGTELAEALEGLGTTLRVSTGWDATTLSFTCTAERLGATLEILAEVVRRPAFPDDEVERVRRQRLAAIRQRAKDPGALADDESDRVLYPPESPFHRPLSGTEESVAALDHERARRWHGDRYRQAGAGLVLVGDLDASEALALAGERFGGWSGGRAPKVEAPAETRVPAERRIVIVDRPGAVQSELRIVHGGPPRAHPDHRALQVANSILGGAFTSRLNLNLRERHGYTYGVYSRFMHRRSAGTFMIATSVETAVSAAALGEALGELERFAEEGPVEEEVSRARDYLAGIFPLRMETTAQLAARVAELVIYGLPDDEHHRYREEIRAVSREEAARAFRAHVDPAGVGIVVCGDAEAVEASLGTLGSVEVRRPAAEGAEP